jgi:hypothetical protein
MGVLDPDLARAALGERLASRFLQYAAAGDEAGAQRLQLSIDEHLAEILAGRTDHALAARIATACKRLLLRWHDAAPDARAGIVGAVRYFLETHDLHRDDQKLGLDDDAQVVSYVVAAVAPDLGPVG